MLHVENIAFRYPKSDYGLQIEEFACEAGRTIAIVGPSGCGKTTFLNLSAGVLRPSRGSIRIGETDLRTLGESAAAAFRLAEVGLIFQEFELVNHLTVRDNILLPLHLGLPLSPEDRGALIERARNLAEQTGIGKLWKERPHHLSQGERQRVAICRALAIDPRLVLADEPTGNLDPSNKDKVLDLMIEFARGDGRALVVATHDVELLDSFDAVVQFDELNQFKLQS
jgi:putative ABC transport system ATP-binding protein